MSLVNDFGNMKAKNSIIQSKEQEYLAWTTT